MIVFEILDYQSGFHPVGGLGVSVPPPPQTPQLLPPKHFPLIELSKLILFCFKMLCKHSGGIKLFPDKHVTKPSQTMHATHTLTYLSHFPPKIASLDETLSVATYKGRMYCKSEGFRLQKQDIIHASRLMSRGMLSHEIVLILGNASAAHVH